MIDRFGCSVGVGARGRIGSALEAGGWGLLIGLWEFLSGVGTQQARLKVEVWRGRQDTKVLTSQGGLSVSCINL